MLVRREMLFAHYIMGEFLELALGSSRGRERRNVIERGAEENDRNDLYIDSRIPRRRNDKEEWHYY